MTRPEKIERAQKLRADGATYREVGDRMGVSPGTTYRWLNPERVAPYRNGRACNPERTRQLDRQYNETHKGECSSCGGPMDRNCDGGVCMACRRDKRDRRARQIEAWWAEGLTMNQIATRLGWSMNHLRQEIHRLREEEYRLPYRYTNGKRKGHKFPEQVPA